MNNLKKKIDLEIVRNDGVTYFKFKIDPAITALYKKVSEEVRESKSWTGLKFYYCPELTQNNAEYTSLLSRYNLIDDYGSGIYHSGKFNIAWIRTINGEGQIKIQNTLTIAALAYIIRDVTAFIKDYFDAFFRSAQIKGSVSVEI